MNDDLLQQMSAGVMTKALSVSLKKKSKKTIVSIFPDSEIRWNRRQDEDSQPGHEPESPHSAYLVLVSYAKKI